MGCFKRIQIWLRKCCEISQHRMSPRCTQLSGLLLNEAAIKPWVGIQRDQVWIQKVAKQIVCGLQRWQSPLQTLMVEMGRRDERVGAQILTVRETTVELAKAGCAELGLQRFGIQSRP